MSPSTEHVTILLSLHDGEPFLETLLDSVQAQYHTDWTLLVRDDGSADRGPVVVAARAAHDPRIVLLADDGRGNLGAAGSFMAMLERVGDEGYFAFCDQDDVWAPHKLAWSLDALRGAPPLAVVATDAEVADAEGRIMHPSALARRGVSGPPTMGRLLVNNVAIGATMTGTAALARAAVEFGRDRPVVMHDWWCALVAAYGGELRLLAAPTIVWRRHQRTVTGSTPSTLGGRLRRRLDYLAWSVEVARTLLATPLEPVDEATADAVIAVAAIDPVRPTIPQLRRARRAGVRAWSRRHELALWAAVAARKWAE